jgi:HPt (histidine-containing phosphotransfer) domain-containing protein
MTNQISNLDQELIDAYFEELEIALKSIADFKQQGVNDTSLNSLKIQIHKIKGNASMLELDDFSALLQVLETHIIESLKSNSYLELKHELIAEVGKICKSMVDERVISNDSINEMIISLKAKMKA